MESHRERSQGFEATPAPPDSYPAIWFSPRTGHITYANLNYQLRQRSAGSTSHQPTDVGATVAPAAPAAPAAAAESTPPAATFTEFGRKVQAGCRPSMQPSRPKLCRLSVQFTGDMNR